MDYRIVVTKELPIVGGIIADLSQYHKDELKVIYSSLEEALRTANRVIAYNYANSNSNIYISIVTFYNCGCEQKIQDIMFIRKIIEKIEVCNSVNTPPTISDEIWNMVGNQQKTLNVDDDISNNDWYQISIIEQPIYGTVFINGYSINYTSIDTTSTLTDKIVYRISNTVNGCYTDGNIDITIN